MNFYIGKISYLICITKINIKLFLITIFLCNFSSYGNINNKNYLSIQSYYNIAHVPLYYNHRGFARWGEKYLKYYDNNFSGNFLYTTGKNRILFQNALSYESFSFSSDTAIGFESCINGNIEQKFTKYGSGNYFCIYSGIELFPIKRLTFFSFTSGISIGYSSNAASYDDIIIGCTPEVIKFDRKLFLGVSVGLSGYIPISGSIDILPCIRYQFRINKLNHVDIGFGLGIRYKFNSE